MKLGRQFVAPTLALVLLFDVACEKKKPQLPAQAKAPVETVQMPLPSEISEEAPPPLPPPPPPQQTAQETPKQQPPKKHKRKPPATQSSQGGNATTTAPSSGNASSGVSGSSPAASNSTTAVAASHPPPNPADTPPDTAIAANVSSAQLTQQKQTTAQLLDSAERTLSGLTRTLSSDEEESITQARSYIAQSRKATSEGDFERAYNLATKAHLLSDALVKK